MTISIQSFMPTLAAAMTLAMVGCGGGNNSVVEPTGNPHLVSADSRIMSPKLMTVDGTDIYFANQGNTGINSVLRISQVESLDTAGYPGFYEVYGVAFNSNRELYVTGKPSSNIAAVLKATSGSPLITSIGSYYGLAFLANDDLISAIQNSPPKTVSVNTSASSYTNSTAVNITETPLSFVRKGQFIYISTQQNRIYKIDTTITPFSPTPLVLTGLALESPNGIAFDGDDMYVVNFGPSTGTGSWIAKITNETTVTEFKKDINWLCASAGIAVRGNYIYVSNGSKDMNGNPITSCGTIPNTTTSNKNTIVKFFH